MNNSHQFSNAAVTFTPAKTATMSSPLSTFTNSPALSSSSTATTMTPDSPTQKQSFDTDNPDKHSPESTYVYSLVDMTVRTIDSIWPVPATTDNASSSNGRTVDTGTFVKTILRLSRTRHSTLLIAIFYLFRIKPRLQKKVAVSSLENRRYMACGRRMFLVSLLLACKYQNDITPKNSVWARVSGLPVTQINQAERLFLELLDYQLFISKESYEQWTTLVERHCQGNAVIATVATAKKTAQSPLPPVDKENQQAFMQSDYHSADPVKKRRVHNHAPEYCAVTHQMPTPPPTEVNEFIDRNSPSKRKWPTA